jgi:hypothetical protein
MRERQRTFAMERELPLWIHRRRTIQPGSSFRVTEAGEPCTYDVEEQQPIAVRAVRPWASPSNHAEAHAVVFARHT